MVKFLKECVMCMLDLKYCPGWDHFGFQVEFLEQYVVWSLVGVFVDVWRGGKELEGFGYLDVGFRYSDI